MAALTSGLMVLLLLCASCATMIEEDLDYEPPLTSWGDPNLQGIWDFRTLTPLERPPEFSDKQVLTQDEARSVRDRAIDALDVDQRSGEAATDIEGAYNTFWYDWGSELNEDLRTSLIIDPPDGQLPKLTPNAATNLREQKRSRSLPVRDLFSLTSGPTEFRPAGPEFLGLSERCLVGLNTGPPLSPGAYNNNLRIIQTPDHVVLLTEMIHDARIVPLNGGAHLPTQIKRWLGDSRARWDGNTLVVETKNFTDKTASFQLPTSIASLDNSGGVGSGLGLFLTERFTPIADRRLRYEYTIDDPQTFERPFTVRISMRATNEPMFEYACHEGNYAVPGMLKGARKLEEE